MKMYLISDNVDTYTGMRLAGVDGIVVHEQDELKQALERVLEDQKYRNCTFDREIRQGVSGDHRYIPIGT